MVSPVVPDIVISRPAIEKLRELVRVWNEAHLDSEVLPALYFRTVGAEQKLVLQVGFLERRKIKDEIILRKNGLDIILDCTEEEIAVLEINNVDFNGEIFELIPRR